MQRLWRSTTNRVMTILDTVQSLKQASELDPNNVWACANLLDSHLMQVHRWITPQTLAHPSTCSTLQAPLLLKPQIDFLYRRLESFQERLVGTENFIARQLDHRHASEECTQVLYTVSNTLSH